MAGFPTAGAAQILSRIVAVLPLPSKITGPAYMETAEGPPDTRTFQAMIQKLGERYSKTDRERSWEMWQEFTSRNRKPAGNVKDFRARMQRVTTRLETLQMKMIEEAIPPQGNAGAEGRRATFRHRTIRTCSRTEQSKRGRPTRHRYQYVRNPSACR